MSVLVGAALTAVTVRVDDRRSTRESKESQEKDWRTRLIKDAEYPRAILRGLDLNGIYAPGVVLAGADLSRAELSEAGLVKARLDSVRAEGTNFSSAQLNDAVLAGADLRGSDFGGAQLAGADLQGALVSKADFTSASLFHSDLRGVDLRKANLAGVDTRYTCFDDSTQWPKGQRPKGAFCDADRKPEPLPGAHFLIDASLLDEIRPNGQTQLYTDSLMLHDRRFILSVLFENRGVVQLQDISVLTVLPTGLKVVPGSARVRNGNNPDGYLFGDGAFQGNQVNVGIGDYGPRSNAFLEMEMDASEIRCGQQLDIDVFATPRRLGTVKDQVRIAIDC